MTPYGPFETLDYYRLMLLDPPFADRLTEWQPSDPGWNTLAFYVLAAVAAAALVLRPAARAPPSTSSLLGFTFVGGVLAIRGVPWFALGAWSSCRLRSARSSRADRRRSGRRVNRTLAAVAGLAVVLTSWSSPSRETRPGTRASGRTTHSRRWPHRRMRARACSRSTARRLAALEAPGATRARRLRRALRDLRRGVLRPPRGLQAPTGRRLEDASPTDTRSWSWTSVSTARTRTSSSPSREPLASTATSASSVVLRPATS